MFKNCPQWKSQQKNRLVETKKLPGPTQAGDRTEIAELFADEWCILATTDAGRTAGPLVAESGEGGANEASEWENREREEQLAR